MKNDNLFIYYNKNTPFYRPLLPISVDTGKCSILLATPDFEAYFSVFAKLGEEKKQSLFLKNDCFLLVLV